MTGASPLGCRFIFPSAFRRELKWCKSAIWWETLNMAAYPPRSPWCHLENPGLTSFSCSCLCLCGMCMCVLMKVHMYTSLPLCANDKQYVGHCLLSKGRKNGIAKFLLVLFGFLLILGMSYFSSKSRSGAAVVLSYCFLLSCFPSQN